MRILKKLSVVCVAIVATLSLVACGKESTSTISSNNVTTPTLSEETKKAPTVETVSTDPVTTAATTKAATGSSLGTPATGTEVTGTGYSLTFPEAWIPSTNEKCDIVMYDGNATGSFTRNINVILEDVSAYGSSMDAAAYCEAAKTQFASSSAYTVTGTEAVTVDGMNAYVLTCDVTQSGAAYKVKQLYVVSGGNAYVTTFSSGVDTYATDLTVGNSILASFKLTK